MYNAQPATTRYRSDSELDTTICGGVVPTQKKDRESDSTTRSSSTTTVEDCQILLRAKVEELRQLYEATMGAAMTPAILRQLLLSVTRGTPWQYYEYALEETALAPRPSWRYTLAIVSRLISEQAPADDVRGSQLRKRKPKPGSLSDYTQREYHHSEDTIDAMMAAWAAGKPI